MHVRAAARHGSRKAAHQPAQILVQQPRRGDHEWRLRGHLPFDAPTAIPAGVAGDRLVADLSLPCFAGTDAPAPYRHRPVQIRRVQAEEHTSELQSLAYLVCRLLLEKKKK